MVCLFLNTSWGRSVIPESVQLSYRRCYRGQRQREVGLKTDLAPPRHWSQRLPKRHKITEQRPAGWERGEDTHTLMSP
ncbi:hypothetical protein B0H65DRAFT_5757 [Neurospora tetraspora]|uniref:Uncharacterized protein n=1 Tax=Neurospora tetraspora TaxID=94610 RepID=A0AAE0JMY7_9PEZI|nr:hypothetical protein B0H65DRAFT_5757 [Neurospora tetraspora]